MAKANTPVPPSQRPVVDLPETLTMAETTEKLPTKRSASNPQYEQLKSYVTSQKSGTVHNIGGLNEAQAAKVGRYLRKIAADAGTKVAVRYIEDTQTVRFRLG